MIPYVEQPAVAIGGYTLHAFTVLMGLAVVAGFEIVVWRRRLPAAAIARFLDCVAFAFPFAWAVARAGCALAHDHPGVPSTHWLAVQFPGGPRWDLGLVEFLYTILIAGAFLLLDRRPRPTGLHAGLFLALYGPARFAMETVRTDDARYLGWTPAQYATPLLAAAGLAVLLAVLRRDGRARSPGGRAPRPPGTRSRSSGGFVAASAPAPRLPMRPGGETRSVANRPPAHEEDVMRNRKGMLARNTGGAMMAAAVLALAALAPPAAASEVVRWNETALKVIADGGQNPVVTTRTLAMVHAAVHDALNTISRRYDAYYFDTPAPAGASPEAAVAAAAHTVLVGVVPGFGTPAQRIAALAAADEAYASALARIPDGSARTAGVAAGRAAGAAIVLLRKDDGATRDAPYTPGTGPGRWRPHPNPVPANPPIPDPTTARGYAPSAMPGWGNVTPFTLLSAGQFWLPGPPALASETYARDYNEVKSLGGTVSSARTPEQTQIARAWFEGPPAWNRIARVVSQARGLDAWDSARVLALMNLAMADAYIAGFKIRYVHDLWRPVTAVREGDTDGNDATAGDPTWNSLQNTPAVSEYPSTQSAFSGAASVALAAAVGTDQVAFSVTSGRPFEGITRSFTSFSQAARESADSRVYAGIHFRSACEDGLALGRRIGERTARLYLQPVRR